MRREGLFTVRDGIRRHGNDGGTLRQVLLDDRIKSVRRLVVELEVFIRIVPNCCDRMDSDLNYRCDKHPDRDDCPDALVKVVQDKYFLIVHDGGSSGIEINFCPWCGKKLSGKRP